MTEEDAIAQDWYSNETATFGDRLADARQVLDMSQADLAKRVGVKLSTLQKWEDDVSEPRANQLNMLSGLLNVTLRWLLTGEGDGLSPPSESPMSHDVAAILTDLRQTQGELALIANRVGRLEKRLKSALS